MSAPVGQQSRLAERIERRTARVAVVGLGYIGLPVTASFVEAGFSVLGFDVDQEKVAQLQRGVSYLRHLGDDLARRLVASGRFEATADLARLGEADAVLVCVPTPLGEDDEPDLRFVTRTMEAVAESLRPGQLVVLESTTWPGTTRQVVQPILEARGLRCGREFFLAFAPERENPGGSVPRRSVPRIVGGLDEASCDLAAALYGHVVDRVVPVSSAEVAEAAKLLENVYRAVNIALVNEVKTILHALGLDVNEVIDAAATKPFGFTAFRPGPGLGGHCIPIDPFYLAHAARRVGVPARFVELAGQVNRAMPEYVVRRTCEALAARGIEVGAARVLVLGVAYKPDVDDVRGSPGIVILERLIGLGARVLYHDPHVPITPPVRHAHLSPMRSVPLDDALLRAQDAVVVVTDHAAIDWDRVARNSRLVIDSRGILRGRGGTVVDA